MTVLITGGAGGIGSEIARVFAAAGHKVAINYNKSDWAAEKLVDEILLAGGKAKMYHADISVSREVNEMVVNVLEDFGTIDVLINNAAVAHQGLITDVTDSIYNKIMDVNVKGTFNVTRAVLPGMIRRKSGSIINISSMWGEVGASCESAYSMTKASVIGLTKALAKEVGPSGITVNCIAPGVISTDMNSVLSSADIDALKEETPLIKIGSAEDVASAALFLSGEGASFITGAVINVNGGLVF